MHCEPESSAPQALFSTVNTGQILSSRVEHADCELAYILSGFTFKGLILVTQDRLRRRLLHCHAQSEDNEDSIADRALYQRHVVWRNVERSRNQRPPHDVIIVFSQIGLFLEVLITTVRKQLNPPLRVLTRHCCWSRSVRKVRMLVNTKPNDRDPAELVVWTGCMQALNGKLTVLIVRKTGEMQGSHLASRSVAENISCIIVTTSRIGVVLYRAILILLSADANQPT